MSVYKYIFTYFPGRQQLLEYDKLSTLLSTIFQLYRGSRFNRWRKPVYPEKTTTYRKWQQLYHIKLYWEHFAMSGIQTQNFSSDRHWLHRYNCYNSTIFLIGFRNWSDGGICFLPYFDMYCVPLDSASKEIVQWKGNLILIN